MKADLDDGFLRISISLEYAMPFFALTKVESDLMHLIRANTWGHATRSPGYICELTPMEMADYLHGRHAVGSIYRSLKSLREKGLLEPDEGVIQINPRCLARLSPEDIDRLEVMLSNHNAKKRYSHPKIKSFRHDSPHGEKNSPHGESPIKDVRAGRERERLKSSSNIAMNDLENTVPNSQTADDDEFKAQSQRLRQELARLGAQRTRKPESEMLAQIDSIAGRTPQELALGMARLIDRMRADPGWAVVSLRGLLATASDPANRNWGAATVESVLGSLRPVAPAPQPVDQDALYAAARAAEREQRMRQT